MIVIRWENDQTDEAPTWQVLLDNVRETQWQTYDTETEFREVMANRALMWSATVIDPGGRPAEFFRELERASLIRIEREVLGSVTSGRC